MISLIPLSEVLEALQALDDVRVGDVPFVEAGALDEAIGKLTGRLDGRLPLLAGPGVLRQTWPPDPSPFTVPDVALSDDERELARLLALPPGPCMCGRSSPDRDSHVHPQGPCGDCPCTDYVDTTIRDLNRVRAERVARGEAPEDVPLEVSPPPLVEQVLDYRRRPPSNERGQPPSG